MAKQQLLKISQIKRRDDLYPRNQTNYITTLRYSSALKTDAVFPPITVAKVKRTYILIDGAHRIEANRMNGETHIQAEVLENLSEKEMFIESVKLNTSHGLQFSAQETAKIVLKLKELKVSKNKIAELVRIPNDRLKPFMAKRMIRIVGDKGGVKGVDILKSELKHLAGTYAGKLDQKKFIGIGQVQIINELIDLIEKDLIDFDNKQVERRMRKLYKLLGNIY